MITETEELEFLQKKMFDAITYQGYFGKAGSEEQMKRQADNCAKLAIQFVNKKIQNLKDLTI